MKSKFWWFGLFVILFTLGSCKKNSDPAPVVPTPDTTVPVINLVDPTPGKSYLLGSPMHLQMDLSDNIELRSYKVVITKSLKGLTTSDWGFNQTWAIAPGNKTLTVNHNEIVIPSTVTGNQTTTGNYDVTITCLDTSNNEASKTLTVSLSK